MKLTIPLNAEFEDPGTKLPTGASVDYFGSDAPEGWLILDGGTIGSPGSGATNRANLDTLSLFVLLWGSLNEGYNPVTPDGRGADALSDFNANKQLTLPDARGRVIAGRDTTASRLTSPVTGNILGASGGDQGHALTVNELPSPTQVNIAVSTNTPSSGGSSSVQGSDQQANSTVEGAGVVAGTTGTAHNNVQPTLIANKIIKL